jgi:hypothetical protein
MIENKKLILKVDLETLTIGMLCLNFLGNLFLHNIHGLVARILASGAGGLGSNPGGIPCGIEEINFGNYGLCMV